MNWHVLYSGVVALIFLLSGCGPARNTSHAHLQATIPRQEDWIDCGPIFAGGVEGEWDLYLWGGFANGVVKRDGTYFLYYQGADGYDDDEGTVTWRAIGVATSTDGIHFTKHPHNPVLTWFPGNHFEEGAVSAGAFIDEQGDIAVYYGANTWVGGSEVNADGRLALSSDGVNFSDAGVILNHADGSLWGAGDELFPVIGIQAAGRWVAYYIPNGVAQSGQLGVAWGDRRDVLVNSAAAQAAGGMVPAWGSGSAVQLDEDVYALFLNNVRGPNGPVTEVRTVSLNRPDRLSAPVQSYQFDNAWQVTVMLERATDTWYMYYRSNEREEYGVRIAPANGRAIACPTVQLYLPLLGRDAHAVARSRIVAH